MLVYHAVWVPISYSQQSHFLCPYFYPPYAIILTDVCHSPCFCMEMEIMEVKYASLWPSLPHLIKTWLCFPISSSKSRNIPHNFPSCCVELHSKYFLHLLLFRKKSDNFLTKHQNLKSTSLKNISVWKYCYPNTLLGTPPVARIQITATT